MSFPDDLVAQAVAQGVGTPGISVFIGSATILPTPQKYPVGDTTQGQGPYLVISETGGLAPVRVSNKTRPNIKRPTAQILATAAALVDAEAMSALAYATFDGIFNATVNGTFYLRIAARQEPTDMGADATGRNFQIVFNVEAELLAP